MSKPSARKVDSNGFMTVRACPLSREGIYEYSAGQIGLDGDPNRIVKVYRPLDAVNDPEAINSFKSVPLINEHEMLNGIGGAHPEYTSPEDKGIDGVLTDNVYFDQNDGWMKGDIKVFTRSMFDALSKGKDDLSLGFGCLFYLEPGEWNGQPYEVVQRRIRGNHLAVVDDGRVEGARIMDAMCFDSLNFTIIPGEKDMQKGIKSRRIIKGSAADSALEKLRAIVPALQAIIAEGQQELGGDAPTATEEPTDVSVAPVTTDEPTVETPMEPAAEPTAEVPVEPTAEPTEEPTAEKPEDVQVLVQQVEALLAQLKDMLAPAPEATTETAETTEATDCDVTGAMVATDEIEPTQTMAATDEVEPTQTMTATDEVEPTQAMDNDLPTGSLTKEATGQDSALAKFYVDQQKKEALYKRVSRVIGAFECAAMDSKAVAVYAAKKLGIQCAQDQAYNVVDVWLNGLAKGQKTASEKALKERAAMDARSTAPELDAWLNGAK